LHAVKIGRDWNVYAPAIREKLDRDNANTPAGRLWARREQVGYALRAEHVCEQLLEKLGPPARRNGGGH
jgi:hypothetical protein